MKVMDRNYVGVMLGLERDIIRAKEKFTFFSSMQERLEHLVEITEEPNKKDNLDVVRILVTKSALVSYVEMLASEQAYCLIKEKYI